MRCLILLLVSYFFAIDLHAQQSPGVKLTAVDTGWASNSVNAVIFRKNSLVTFKGTQYIAFYSQDKFVMLGKRKSGSGNWQIVKTPYRGNAADAHNTISIMMDGDGYLHLAWDHHNNPLNYCKSIKPGSLELTKRLSMTGINEQKVSYPEFYKLANGNLLFFYRDGGSGNGNLVINQYNKSSKKWVQVQHNLVDGEGQRNAYWQSCTGNDGTIYISWVWRESPDVASNHDLCYACSHDGGKTWEKSTGEKYQLPITAATAEYICNIPQNSELINQTSMVADNKGHPFIATYWRDAGDSVPQYHIVYKTESEWQIRNTRFRKTPFSLSGMGTKSIPVSRPQIIAWNTKQRLQVAVIFRDEERGSKPSVAVNTDAGMTKWKVSDLDQTSLGNWEPTYDTELWKEKSVLDLFIQKVIQADAEGNSKTPPQAIKVLEWNATHNH